MELLTVGFVFDASLEHVLLLHKKKPDWQVGRLNGLGGKVEDGETAVACVARECREETCLNIPTERWTKCATVHQTDATGNEKVVDFFATTHEGDLSDAKRGDYEDVEWFNCLAPLPNNTLQNLHFLVPLARETLRGHKADVTIQY